MTSARAKGNALELKAKKELEAAGYNVERANPVLMWIGPGKVISRRHDFWGAFDLIAASPREVRLIQVCADAPGSAADRRKKIEAVAPLFPQICSFELWRWRGGRVRKGDRLPRGWIKEKFEGEEWRPLDG